MNDKNHRDDIERKLKNANALAQEITTRTNNIDRKLKIAEKKINKIEKYLKRKAFLNKVEAFWKDIFTKRK